MSYNAPTLEELKEGRTAPIIASDGEQIGHVGEIWVGDDGNPEYLKVGRGFLGLSDRLVPVRGGHFEDDGFHVPYTKDQLDEGPELDDDDVMELDEDRVTSYRSHYDRYDRDVDVERDRTDEGDGAVTRSEEELQVGKREVEAGSARLRKWVETEPVQADVELKRETVHVDRQPIDEVVSGGQIGEEEIDVSLKREEAVVEKQVVGKERISLDKDVETTTETVSDEVRKERVEVDEDR
ncbi:MAG: YsnF/AvaK domain-containing protein [Actinobacteria bacterium]|nr:YsnF/AvaK domain-containing protein [Actinomycetota bacterium]